MSRLPRRSPADLSRLVRSIRESDPDLFGKLEALGGTVDLGDLERRRAALDEIVSRPVAEGRGFEPAGPQGALETIVMKYGRPVLAIKNDDVEVEFADDHERDLWEGRLSAARAALRKAIPAIGRVEVDGHPRYDWIGTANLIEPDLVVTNRHVAAELGMAAGTRFVFRRGIGARVDFREEIGSASEREHRVEEILYIAPESGPDVAFLRVSRAGSDGPLAPAIRLAASSPAADAYVAVIGYPAYDSRVPDVDAMERIYGGVYDKKRLAPGQVLGTKPGSLTHNCTTLGGNSGSGVVDMATGELVGLHFSGSYLKANFAVPAGTLRSLLADRASWGRGTLDSAPAARPAVTLPAPTPAAPAVAPARAVVSAGAGEATLRLEIPLEITVRLGSAAPGVAGGAAAGPGPRPASLESALAEARERLLSVPGVRGVRAGWRFQDGWITDDRALVVTLERSAFVEGPATLPSEIGGFPVEVRPENPAEEVLSQIPDAGTAEAPHKFVSNYRKRTAAKYSLAPIEEPMKVTCHVSPEAGWRTLEAFLARTRKGLDVAMYDFGAPHIVDAVEDAVRGGADRELRLVIQHKATVGGTTKKDDLVDEEVVERYQESLAGRFAVAWAPVTGARRLFDNAYHIKVAVRDGREFWLSSGNWQSSNQPPLTALPSDTDPKPLRLYNREWHAVIENDTLARRLAAHIQQDFRDAEAAVDEGLAPVELPDLLVPASWLEAPDEELPPKVRYFEPLVVNRRVRVQPVLTPDNYADVVLELIEGATTSILFQNQSFKPARNDARYERLLEALLRKQKAGLDVRIVFRRFGDTKAELETIKDFGFATSRDQLRPQTNCHTKGIVVDGERVLVGSHNWTTSGTVFNRDASLLFDDREIAGYFAEVFEFDWERIRGAAADDELPRVRRADDVAPESAATEGLVRVSWSEWAGL